MSTVLLVVFSMARLSEQEVGSEEVKEAVRMSVSAFSPARLTVLVSGAST
jgi:hypothetical protein